MIKGGEQLNRLSVKGANKDSSPFRESELYLREKLGPELPLRALILGSGFQRVLESFQVEAELNVAEIVGFPRLQVQGHSGRLLVARIEGLRVLVLSGWRAGRKERCVPRIGALGCRCASASGGR